MKKHDYLFIALFLGLIIWLFRYDTHCNDIPFTCVSYDRYTGEWVNPALLARNARNEKIVKALIASTKSKMDYKEALLHGYSYEEIISELRK